jgi:hypothetical protein
MPECRKRIVPCRLRVAVANGESESRKRMLQRIAPALRFAPLLFRVSAPTSTPDTADAGDDGGSWTDQSARVDGGEFVLEESRTSLPGSGHMLSSPSGTVALGGWQMNVEASVTPSVGAGSVALGMSRHGPCLSGQANLASVVLLGGREVARVQEFGGEDFDEHVRRHRFVRVELEEPSL